MRSSNILSTVALASTALAGPLQNRDVQVIDTVYDYATVVVVETVTDAGPAPVETVAPMNKYAHYGHWTRTWAQTSAETAATPEASVVTVVQSSAEPSSVRVAPTTAEASPAATSVAAAEPASYETAASSAAAAPASTPASGYQQLVLAHHNVHRANHSANALEWDDGLASSAATIAATCVFEHSMDVNGGGYGQNINMQTTDDIGSVISDGFYNGEMNAYQSSYGQPNPVTDAMIGHFTQVVWKGTTKVACATQSCGANGYFTVCNYGPPGNYGGQYGTNVGQCEGKPTVTGSDSV